MILALLIACGGRDEPTGQTSAQPTDTAAPSSPYESALVCAECHPSQYADWSQSMHAYAAKSPAFDAMTAKAYRDSSGEIGTFCTGCHTPVGTEAGEPGFTTAATRSALSLEGIGCDYCHTATGNSGLIGNLSVTNEPGMVKRGPYSDASSTAAHSSTYGEFVTSPELCGSCHDVFKFPGLQIEEAYSEHITSPSYAEGTRCQDCHMSPTPGVPSAKEVGPIAVVEGETYPDRELSSHQFIGPDYALVDDFPYPDDLEASAEAQREHLELVQALLEASVHIASADALLTDDQLTLRIDVESLTPGHNVPTGFTSERQLWLEVVVTDSTGAVVFTSGDLDSYGDLRDPLSTEVIAGTAQLDEQLVNFQSKNITLAASYSSEGQYNGGVSEQGESMFPFEANFIEKHSLEPLERRQQEFTVTCTPDCSEVAVRLRYRNLPPYVLRALGAGELVERLHIFDLDAAEIEL